ncbi:hypothetical protein ACM46_20190 [Chryseobacterium angstadtii]|uniref:Secretion system C-terminal sorting domain-containing protein n=1 Tax=Chryseobacterium angstadtii TaxID=558151 RepID=A0A0J7HYW1_9FLAO|nr:T9SS type A sorting domain-containing protein [Chryseobacterium angstadtii]KMQ59418.1 hypothetical protein ACM46_20190 [Chryseobacterium angstadtii]
MKKLLTLFVIASLGFFANAQWNPVLNENLSVTKQAGGASFSATTSSGKTYIGYWRSAPAPTNYELWLQILDQNGMKELPGDGVMLSNQIPMNTYTVVEKIAVDSSDNLYIGVTGTGTGNPGFVFKVTPQGTSAWPNGLSLGEAYLPTILPLSGGDIVVAYYPPTQKYTKVQRFNAAGQPVWANPIQIISDDVTKNTIPADLFELSDNECEIIFHKQLSFGTSSYLFAHKIGLNGTLAWDGAKQIAPKTTAYNAKYSGAVDGNVVYYGYSTGENMRFDGYLQRVNADGTLPWGLAGIDFDTNQTYFEKDMKIAFSPGSSYIWSIANYSSSSQGENGEFVQKFDKNTGTRLLTDHGKQVFPIDNVSIYHFGDLQLVNDSPYFVVRKKEGTSAVNISLNAVQLTNNGDFAWPQNYLPMATYLASKAYINVLKPVNGQSVIVFQEQKSSDASLAIYAQNLILPNGTMAVHEASQKDPSIRIYPNPATDVIYVDGMKDQNFSIYNAAGQVVKMGNLKQGRIEVSDLIKGNYVLKIKDKAEAAKFIKK